MSVNEPTATARTGIANCLAAPYDLVFMKRLLLLLSIFWLAPALLLAQGPDEQYVRIYQVIQEADRLSGMGQTRAAAAKYVEAREALIRFSAIFPGWNERVVNYRISYISTKLAPLSALTSAPSATTSPNTNASTTPSLPPGSNVVVTPPPVTAAPWSAEFDNQMKSLQNEVARLQGDNKALSAKLKEALSAQPATIDPADMAKAEERIRSLQKENELFKAQLAQMASAPPAAAQELTSKLAEQNEAIGALRTENEILKRQSAELREKYAALSSSVEATRAQLNSKAAETEVALRKASTENMGLQKELELWKQVAQDNIKKVAMASIPSMPPDAQQELLALRARVQSLEAQPVPYTAEELALFNKPASVMVANLNTPTSPAAPTVLPAEGALPKKISRGIPPGAGPLLRAAERAFATQQYAEAEKKYLEVLHQDENNVTTLGNLASAQVELGKYAEAETNARRALALDPTDYFSLYVMGRIRFRENKLDAALDSLSRSAQANPNYADAQNYLGIVLSEKGQRGPAETALRRAIQLQPDNPVAHNNLAVVYATQKPPALALARWHYQKARSSGHPANAELEKILEQKQ
jgi:tetratricopeptide (TPR) repeat protein